MTLTSGQTPSTAPSPALHRRLGATRRPRSGLPTGPARSGTPASPFPHRAPRPPRRVCLFADSSLFPRGCRVPEGSPCSSVDVRLFASQKTAPRRAGAPHESDEGAAERPRGGDARGSAPKRTGLPTGVCSVRQSPVPFVLPPPSSPRPILHAPTFPVTVSCGAGRSVVEEQSQPTPGKARRGLRWPASV